MSPLVTYNSTGSPAVYYVPPPGSLKALKLLELINCQYSSFINSFGNFIIIIFIIIIIIVIIIIIIIIIILLHWCIEMAFSFPLRSKDSVGKLDACGGNLNEV